MVANIPAAQIEAIENGVAVTRHIAVAGKPDRPSPDINSKIIQINFNPFWTVPVSIVRKDLIPKMQAEPDYLTKNHIRIFDAKNNEQPPSQIDWYSTEAVNYKFKQDAGNFNSLGSISINFPSPHGVYMHDTPSKNLFGEDFRFASSGCMRVQNVRELVYWILQESPGWSRPEIDEVIKSGDRKDAKVAKPVPLHWVYVTAWATPDGVVQFRDDIYNRDGFGAPGQCGEGVGLTDSPWLYPLCAPAVEMLDDGACGNGRPSRGSADARSDRRRFRRAARTFRLSAGKRMRRT